MDDKKVNSPRRPSIGNLHQPGGIFNKKGNNINYILSKRIYYLEQMLIPLLFDELIWADIFFKLIKT
jgi:hypothetical protein